MLLNYLRWQVNLSPNSSSKALLYIILSPVQAYLGDDTKPKRLYANPNYVRAWQGGTGFAKMGCNYAPTMYVQVMYFYSTLFQYSVIANRSFDFNSTERGSRKWMPASIMVVRTGRRSIRNRSHVIFRLFHQRSRRYARVE